MLRDFKFLCCNFEKNYDIEEIENVFINFNDLDLFRVLLYVIYELVYNFKFDRIFIKFKSKGFDILILFFRISER